MGQDEPMSIRISGPDWPEEVIPVGPNETALLAAERAGLELPFGCREGRCSSCTAKLVDGEFGHVQAPKALDDERRAANYVLLCIGQPRSHCTLEVGTHVREEAFPGLWGGDP